jgi:hypothetical protein
VVKPSQQVVAYPHSTFYSFLPKKLYHFAGELRTVNRRTEPVVVHVLIQTGKISSLHSRCYSETFRIRGSFVSMLERLSERTT